MPRGIQCITQQKKTTGRCDRNKVALKINHYTFDSFLLLCHARKKNNNSRNRTICQEQFSKLQKKFFNASKHTLSWVLIKCTIKENEIHFQIIPDTHFKSSVICGNTTQLTSCSGEHQTFNFLTTEINHIVQAYSKPFLDLHVGFQFGI